MPKQTDTFEAFFRFLEEQDKSPKTVRAYKSDLTAFRRWFETTNNFTPTPHLVSPVDVRDYRQYMLAVKRLSSGTINRRLSALRAWMDWAVQSGLMDFNPIAHVRGVGKTQAAEIHWLSPQEEGKLIRTVEREIHAATTEAGRRKALRNRALVILLLNTGLRANEALSLRLDDVNIGERKGEAHVRFGKRGKARTVPLNKQARKALQDWLKVRPDEGDYIFCGRGGGHLDNSQLRRVMKYLARVSGVEFSAHSLRHTFGKRLIDAGVSLEKVAALLGHANLNTTRIYITPGRDDLRRAVETLEY